MYSVAKAWLHEYGEMPWKVALEVTTKAASQDLGGAVAQKQRIAGYADALHSPYFLVCVGGKVEVVYGFWVCHLLDAGGLVYAGLMTRTCVKVWRKTCLRESDC